MSMHATGYRCDRRRRDTVRERTRGIRRMLVMFAGSVGRVFPYDRGDFYPHPAYPTELVSVPRSLRARLGRYV